MVKIIFSDLFVKRLNEAEIKNVLSKFYDEKMGRSIVFRYNARSNWFQDIRNVFKQTIEEDAELLDYYSDFVNESMNNDEKAFVLAEAVNDRLTYKTDIENFGKIEYWANPITTHRLAVDDCDGYACLICYLWGLFGIPSFRRFVRAGDVFTDAGNKFYHATAIYLSEKRNEFFALEGSFYKNRTNKKFNKIQMRKMGEYGFDTWFITNEEKTYTTSKFRIKFVR